MEVFTCNLTPSNPSVSPLSSIPSYSLSSSPLFIPLHSPSLFPEHSPFLFSPRCGFLVPIFLLQMAIFFILLRCTFPSTSFPYPLFLLLYSISLSPAVCLSFFYSFYLLQNSTLFILLLPVHYFVNSYKLAPTLPPFLPVLGYPSSPFSASLIIPSLLYPTLLSHNPPFLPIFIQSLHFLLLLLTRLLFLATPLSSFRLLIAVFLQLV